MIRGYGNQFYEDVANQLDEIIHIFNDQFGDGTDGGGDGSGTGGTGGIGGAGGVGGAGGSTSKFSKFMGKAGKVMAIANGIERSVNGTLSSLK